MAVAMVPYAQKIVSDYLRVHPDVAALGARVVSKTPGDTSTSWVRVSRLDAGQDPRDTADHLISFLMQFDCYAGDTGGLPEATLLGRTVRAALQDIAAYDHDEAVLTGCRITGDAGVPDTTVDEPARDRIILTAIVYGHAA